MARDGSSGGDEPGWLAIWRERGLGRDAALSRFDALDTLEPADMLGTWRGADLPSGHPFDGALTRLGWHGKRFDGLDEAHPLLFDDGRGGAVPLSPARLSAGLTLRYPRLARLPGAAAAIALLRPLLRAPGPAARLRSVVRDGRASAAMIYDDFPIIDHFRRADARRVVALMDARAFAPFFFLLTRGD